MNTETTKQKPVLRGELALIFAVCLNSFGVVLMLYSTYLFQGLLVVTLMVLENGLCRLTCSALW